MAFKTVGLVMALTFLAAAQTTNGMYDSWAGNGTDLPSGSTDN